MATSLKRKRARSRRRELNATREGVSIPVEQLRYLLRNKSWGSFNSRSILKIKDVYFMARVGFFMGKIVIAVIARQQFVVVKPLPEEAISGLLKWDKVRAFKRSILNPKITKTGEGIRDIANLIHNTYLEKLLKENIFSDLEQGELNDLRSNTDSVANLDPEAIGGVAGHCGTAHTQ